jgi:putative exporter of polyketide antibiotics
MVTRTNKIINGFAAIIGFAISAFSTWALYGATHKFYQCLTTPNQNLTACSSNDDFLPVMFQIIGIFIPIFTMLWTTNFKKDD